MALGTFDHKLKPPQPQDLAATPGRTFVFWNQLRTALETRFGPLSFEWGFTSK